MDWASPSSWGVSIQAGLVCGFLGNYIVAALICFLLPEKTEADRHHRFISSAEGNDQFSIIESNCSLTVVEFGLEHIQILVWFFFFLKIKRKEQEAMPWTEERNETILHRLNSSPSSKALQETTVRVFIDSPGGGGRLEAARLSTNWPVCKSCGQPSCGLSGFCTLDARAVSRPVSSTNLVSSFSFVFYPFSRLSEQQHPRSACPESPPTPDYYY